jgi:predicted nucleic acid-binding protein
MTSAATPQSVQHLTITRPDDWHLHVRDGAALQALTVAHQLGLRRHVSRALWLRAWELRLNLSAYDALYVALAEQLQVPLLTADARLARAPGLRCCVELIAP